MLEHSFLRQASLSQMWFFFDPADNTPKTQRFNIELGVEGAVETVARKNTSRLLRGSPFEMVLFKSRHGPDDVPGKRNLPCALDACECSCPTDGRQGDKEFSR